jgi:hypothetical protein
MPTLAAYPAGLSMSTSGKLVTAIGVESDGAGVQLFHFNGAAPITLYGSILLPGVTIDQVAWDNNNHMYALSYSAGQLYVYTATPTSIKAVAGSPYTIPSPYGSHGMVVVPK